MKTQTTKSIAFAVKPSSEVFDLLSAVSLSLNVPPLFLLFGVAEINKHFNFIQLNTTIICTVVSRRIKSTVLAS